LVEQKFKESKNTYHGYFSSIKNHLLQLIWTMDKSCTVTKTLNKLDLQSHRGTKEMKARRKENNAIFKQVPGYKVTFFQPFDPLK